MDSDEQQQRSMMRERFLRMLSSMENRELIIQMYQNAATVTGTYRSVDNDMLNLHVHSLRTPIGLVPEALLRINDISFIEFSMKENEMK